MLESPDALLTTHEVAALLRVHPKHVYRLLKRGIPTRRAGGKWLFPRDEVLRWAESSAHPRPGPEPEPTRTETWRWRRCCCGITRRAIR